MSAAERYLVLGLRLGKHVDGLVDAYYGPAELQAQVDAEEPIEAAQLAADADALLAELDDGWLADQVQGCATYAHVLAGDDDFVQRRGRRLLRRSPRRVAGIRLRGSARASSTSSCRATARSSSGGRRGASSTAAPATRPSPCSTTCCRSCALARPRLVELPAGEELTLEPVQDEPWWAFNYYQGNLHSRVVLNTDIPTSGRDLLRLAGHEVYPGHHTEHALKEQLLMRDQGRIEEGIQLVPTPQALLSEGIAEAGLDVVLDDAARDEAYEIIRRHGVFLDDPGLVEQIATAFEGLAHGRGRRCADGPRGRRLGRRG